MWDQGSKVRRVGSGITAPGSGITSHGIGISSLLGDQGSGCTILWDQGPKSVMLLESIKDRKNWVQNGISNYVKTHLVTTLKHATIFKNQSMKI